MLICSCDILCRKMRSASTADFRPQNNLLQNSQQLFFLCFWWWVIYFRIYICHVCTMGRNSLLYSGCALSINPVPTRLCPVIICHRDKKYPCLASGNRVSSLMRRVFFSVRILRNQTRNSISYPLCIEYCKNFGGGVLFFM